MEIEMEKIARSGKRKTISLGGLPKKYLPSPFFKLVG